MGRLGGVDQRVRIEDLLDRRPPECGGEVGTVFQSGENGYVNPPAISFPLLDHFLCLILAYFCVFETERTILLMYETLARDIDVGVEFNLGL